MEAFLAGSLPSLLPVGVTWVLHVYQGKFDLLRKLPSRLAGYKAWLPADRRIVVLVDRDDDDPMALKSSLEALAQAAGLTTKTSCGTDVWQCANRIAVEELEAWFFGDWEAVRSVYPRVSATQRSKAGFRDPDDIAGGTWEALERLLKNAGYFKEGLRKVELATEVARTFDPDRCTSTSFRQFRAALESATA